MNNNTEKTISLGKIRVVNYGPFREAEVEIKPLTIFIGKNNTGKSFLLYTIWLFTTTTPDIDFWRESVNLRQYFDDIRNNLHNREYVRDMLRKVFLDYFATFPKALEKSLHGKFREIFGVEPYELIYDNKDKAFIQLADLTSKVIIDIEISRDKGIQVKYHEDYSELFFDLMEDLEIISTDSVLNKVSVKLSLLSDLFIRSTGEFEISLTDIFSFHNSIFMLVGLIIKTLFFAYFYAESSAPLLVDGKAGIARTMLVSFPDPGVLKNMSRSDVQFIKLYYSLAESLYRNEINLDLAKSFLREIGIEEVIPIIRAGLPVIRVKTTSGKIIPFERASSGTREELLTILSLIAPTREYNFLVFIEEPEAHLHPKAIRELARLIVNVINKGKPLGVIITTHSDYLVFSINNHIIMFNKTEEGLSPSLVSAYLFKNICEDSECYSVVEKLRVDENGIDESEFEKIIEELADERSRFYKH